MDLIAIGKFIKEKRIEKGLTELELAKKISVSELSISKWESGNSFPSTKIMLSLCRELDVTANELLTGKKLSNEEYKISAEKNIIALKEAQDEIAKFALKLEIVIGSIVTFSFISMLLIASILDLELWLRTIICVLGLLIFSLGMHFCLLIEKDVGYYECQHCHNQYIPTYNQVLWASHFNRTRHMKCPKCGKKSWQKKVLK